MFITPDQLLAHAVGDYVLQSDWMATEKTKRSTAAAAHALCYALPFLFLTRSLVALAFIAGTHFVIDRWRLARYVCWVKNFLTPRVLKRSQLVPPGGVLRGEVSWNAATGEISNVSRHRNLPWAECSVTGYGPEKPQWMAVWLLIIADNIMHVILNGVALQIWG